MKRIIIAIIAIAGLSASLSSCKSHETCPAYGQAEAVSVEVNG
ncbi:MAG: hypothetical protein NWS74_10940 [Salibacteraceae bacterium]|jgi:hypothetical protein|nr:hypothetical protein [Salibacteraceae bacterium]MDP4686653.1 hypothetical protein [Salibacteraceae bacterium]MDP4763599.1 hypothetical protein [Salibacteraceae bacterium]MDP4844976.1 hypothetical protein [Salibacteraceae bacterium]MDP4934683.1 hypothetical protein [Salibacteraceae bacterium]